MKPFIFLLALIVSSSAMASAPRTCDRPAIQNAEAVAAIYFKESGLTTTAQKLNRKKTRILDRDSSNGSTLIRVEVYNKYVDPFHCIYKLQLSAKSEFCSLDSLELEECSG